MKNNQGPIIETCGTPIFKGNISDLQSSIPVYCFLFLSNFQIVSEMNLPVRKMLAYVIQSNDQLYQMPLIGQEICQLNISCIHSIYDSIYQFKCCIFSRMFRSKAILVRKEETIFLKIR